MGMCGWPLMIRGWSCRREEQEPIIPGAKARIRWVRNAGTEVPAYLRGNGKRNDKCQYRGLSTAPREERAAAVEMTEVVGCGRERSFAAANDTPRSTSGDPTLPRKGRASRMGHPV
jgi:hypothetical protein